MEWYYTFLSDPQVKAWATRPLIDFTFNVGGANLGISVLLQQLNAGNYKQAGVGFLGWLRPANIRGRRVDEKNLWDSGRYISNGHVIP